MRLDLWLAKKGVSRDAFAAAIGVEAASLSRYINGQRLPRRAVLVRITKATDGQVTANDFVTGQELVPNPNAAQAAE